MKGKPIILLVDSACGVYSYLRLASAYVLHMENGEAYDAETLKAEFNPDNQEWAENIEQREGEGLYVYEKDSNAFYRVAAIEGDIFGIHEHAEYNEEYDSYTLPS